MGRKHKNKDRLPQRDSKMSNGRLSGVSCWPHGRKTEIAPPQRDSIMSKLPEVRIKTENRKTRIRPAQRYSKNSNLVSHLCNLRNLRTNLLSAQLDSGNSILGMGEQGIMTVLVRNLAGCFMGGWGNEPMSKMQNGSAQRHSKMSNLKIETENSLPQRHSKMSNGRLSGVLCWPHGQDGMFTMQIKNVGRWL